MPGTPFDGLTSIANSALDELGLTNRNGGPEGPGRSIIIEEQNVANPRQIVLRGRAMPYQGVPWGGEQAYKKTDYPGNPVATIQILGPRENDTTMEGMWKDRFLSGSVLVTDASSVGGGEAPEALAGAATQAAGNAVNSATGGLTGGLIGGGGGQFELAEDVAQLFHGIRRAGTLLRVQWLSETRFGIISEFEADYDRPQDLRWSMTFTWLSWDDDQSTRSATQPENSSSLLDTFNQIVDAVALAPVVARAVQAQLVSSIDTIGNTTGVLFNVLETFDAVVDTPGAVLGQMQNLRQQLDRQLTELVQGLADVRWPNTASATAIAGPTTNPVGSTKSRSSVTKQELEFERWRRTVARLCLSLRRTSADAVDQRLERLSPRTTRIVTVSAGTTLYDLSRRFYGSPDFATYLAGVNRLSGARVDPGTTVRVPPRPTGPVSRDATLSGGRRKADECGDC